jgi:hypothetical protein
MRTRRANMSKHDDPGEYIPPRRIEEGDPVLFYDLSVSEDKERGRVLAVDHSNEEQRASILIYSDERTEADVPFAYGDFQPERGYVYDDEIYEGGL